MSIVNKIAYNLSPPILLELFKKIFQKKKYASSLENKPEQLNTDRNYMVADCAIILPNNHFLDVFQDKFPTYDRLITVLPKYINKKSTVIDIGANIGDSAIPFLKNGIKTVCVEPSSLYVKYLKKNIAINNFQNITTVIQKIVSTKLSKGQISIEQGTASQSNIYNQNKDVQIEECASIKLDELVNGISDISLVKIDTDGYDYDVILSGMNFFKQNAPLLYFENYITEQNRDKYEKAYNFLDNAGYNRVAIFDNKGLLLLRNGKWNNLQDLNMYISSKSCEGISYTDVLCYKENNVDLVAEIIEEYVNFYLKQN